MKPQPLATTLVILGAIGIAIVATLAGPGNRPGNDARLERARTGAREIGIHFIRGVEDGRTLDELVEELPGLLADTEIHLILIEPDREVSARATEQSDFDRTLIAAAIPVVEPRWVTFRGLRKIGKKSTTDDLADWLAIARHVEPPAE